MTRTGAPRRRRRRDHRRRDRLCREAWSSSPQPRPRRWGRCPSPAVAADARRATRACWRPGRWRRGRRVLVEEGDTVTAGQAPCARCHASDAEVVQAEAAAAAGHRPPNRGRGSQAARSAVGDAGVAGRAAVDAAVRDGTPWAAHRAANAEGRARAGLPGTRQLTAARRGGLPAAAEVAAPRRHAQAALTAQAAVADLTLSAVRWHRRLTRRDRGRDGDAGAPIARVADVVGWSVDLDEGPVVTSGRRRRRPDHGRRIAGVGSQLASRRSRRRRDLDRRHRLHRYARADAATCRRLAGTGVQRRDRRRAVTGVQGGGADGY